MSHTPTSLFPALPRSFYANSLQGIYLNIYPPSIDDDNEEFEKSRALIDEDFHAGYLGDNDEPVSPVPIAIPQFMASNKNAKAKGYMPNRRPSSRPCSSAQPTGAYVSNPEDEQEDWEPLIVHRPSRFNPQLLTHFRHDHRYRTQPVTPIYLGPPRACTSDALSTIPFPGEFISNPHMFDEAEELDWDHPLRPKATIKSFFDPPARGMRIVPLERTTKICSKLRSIEAIMEEDRKRKGMYLKPPMLHVIPQGVEVKSFPCVRGNYPTW